MEKYKSKLDKICKEKKYSYRIHGEQAVIDTNMDTWIIVEMDNYKKNKNYKPFLVRHQSKSSKKMRTHKQRYALDLDYIFNNIIEPHEQYAGVYSKMFRIDRLLKEEENKKYKN